MVEVVDDDASVDNNNNSSSHEPKDPTVVVNDMIPVVQNNTYEFNEGTGVPLQNTNNPIIEQTEDIMFDTNDHEKKKETPDDGVVLETCTI